MVKKLHQLKEGKKKLYHPNQTLLHIDENVSCSMEKHFLTAFGDYDLLASYQVVYLVTAGN